jgi:predicted MFS family arabinose efflux permease
VFFYGYIIVIASFFITLVVYAVQYAFGVFFKPMLSEFGWTRALTSGAFSLSWIVQGIMAIVMGKLSDRLGPRLVITICGFLIGISYLLMSQITDVWQFYVLFGLLAGTGVSGIIVPLGSTVARWFVTKRNMMTAFAFLGVSIGVLIGSPISEMLISTFDWRFSYLILGSIVFIIVILVAQFLSRDPSEKKQLPFGNNEQQNKSENEANNLTVNEAIRVKQFWFVFFIFLCLGYINFAIFVHIVPYTTDLGIDPSVAAGVMSIMGGSSAIGGFSLSLIADRIGNRKVYIIAFSILFLSGMFLLFATDILRLYVFAIAFSFALGGCCMTQSPMVASLFGLKSHGIVFGVLNFSFSVGATLGSLITGYIFDISGNYQMAFIITAIFGLIGTSLTFWLKPPGIIQR